jgi:hypothetical protein
MRLINRAYDIMEARNYPCLYVALDIHDTVWAGTKHKEDDTVSAYYPWAKEVLRYWSRKPEVKIILYTCSYPKQIEKIWFRLLGDGIKVAYANENPEIGNSKTGCFDQKFYSQIIIDDKAGFNGETDWLWVKMALEQIYNDRIQ